MTFDWNRLTEKSSAFSCSSFSLIFFNSFFLPPGEVFVISWLDLLYRSTPLVLITPNPIHYDDQDFLVGCSRVCHASCRTFHSRTFLYGTEQALG
jgi:hypothetical protein